MNKIYIYNDNDDDRTCYYQPPINIMEKLGWNCVHISSCADLELFTNKNKLAITSCLLFFNCYEFMHKNFNYLKNNNIKVYVYENDLHQIPTRKENNIKGESLRNMYINLPKLYVCATYWYCYNNFFPLYPKEKIIPYPTFIRDDYNIEFNDNPETKMLLSGAITKEYPARKKMISLMNINKNISRLKHTSNIRGKEYIKYINKYICGFTCCANKYTPYIVNKFFEIPSAGSLLLAYDEYVKEPLKELGYIDGINYISCTLDNMEEKINYIVDPKNKIEIDIIRKNGYNFVWKNHKLSDRLIKLNEYIDKLN